MKENNFLSFLLLDDHEIVFSGLQLLFSNRPNKIVLDHVVDANLCLAALNEKKYDLLILDVVINDTNVFDLVDQILIKYLGQKILIYSMNSEELYTKRFLAIGAKGYLSKSTSNDELVQAIETILAGKIFVSNAYKNHLAENMFLKPKNVNPFETLTEKEFRILRLFLQGYTSKEVGNIANLHSSTIGTYKSKILEKTKTKNLLGLMEMSKIYGLN